MFMLNVPIQKLRLRSRHNLDIRDKISLKLIFLLSPGKLVLYVRLLYLAIKMSSFL